MSEVTDVGQATEAPFVPVDFEVPEVFETADFRLRKLTAADVDKDYEAVMASADLLHTMFGTEWPRAGFTREENLKDLVEHEEEFERREAFAYTVESLDGETTLGCVYINPPRGRPVGARVYMWVRQSAHDAGLDPILFETVKGWLATSWPLRNVAFPGRTAEGQWLPGAWAKPQPS
jgi:hypothetical protein